MAYITGEDRAQRQLLPDSVEQYVGAEHPVRAIDAFAGALDLAKLKFTKAQPAPTGRPPYHPGDLLRLYLWGYCNRVRSSRRLETECGRNLEVLWLLRRLQPDFKTIADFRRDNAEALKAVFRQFVLLCRELGLYGRELVAMDGTQLKASNHPTRRAGAEKITREIEQIDARIAEYLAAVAQSDAELELGAAAPVPAEPMAAKLAALRRRKEHFGQALAVALASGEKAPLSDPECQRLSKVGLGYNVQSAVDDKHHLLAVAEVAEEPTDYGQLPVIAAAAAEVLQAPALKAVADGGYHSQVALAAAEATGLQSYVPRPEKGTAAHRGLFGRKDFVYEPARDAYRCLAGALLARSGGLHARHGLHYQSYANPAACRACPLQTQCTTGAYRRVERWEKEAVMEAVAERTGDHPEIIRRRKALVEHPFGTIKFWWHQGALLTRGRRMVQAEWSLSAFAYNLQRALAVLGVNGLIEGLRKVREKVRSHARSGLAALGTLPGLLLPPRRPRVGRSAEIGSSPNGKLTFAAA